MEFLRRMICFTAGFIAAASLVVMDDRMAVNYGYESPWEAEDYVREAASHVETALSRGKELGEFYGAYFDGLATAFREEWADRNEGTEEGDEEGREPETLEAFHTQKL